ncbi:MAG: TIGR03668 family PPOX class F420-dependent oxidoreductase [Chloroflexi bacterium]|nr:TIGR03668 family PPOX class F420-dependent oxidoreductase [Chloroflexota bacterium]
MDEQARRFLERQRVAHLATADASGLPHVVPICFALVDETLYVAIDEKPKRGPPMQLRRLRNIDQNPRVAVVADIYDDTDWARLGFVLVRGRARVLRAGAEHVRALDALRTRYAQYRSMALEQRPVIAVAIDRVTSWGQVNE